MENKTISILLVSVLGPLYLLAIIITIILELYTYITAVCIINCRSNTTAFVWPPNSMSVGDPGISVKGHSHYKICASVGLSGLASGLPMKSCRDMGPGDLPISHGR